MFLQLFVNSKTQNTKKYLVSSYLLVQIMQLRKNNSNSASINNQ